VATEDVTLQFEGKNFMKSEEGFRGKKAVQMAKMIEYLQANPDEPVSMEYLCELVEQKYPQDVQAGFMALFFVEEIDVYKTSADNKTYFVWRGSPDPTNASA
jgi:hypothetical protein